jgi:glycosyltransferase involved in cell wall biosynthesis
MSHPAMTTTHHANSRRRMKIAWFTHRYHPCLGGAEKYGREMVRRFVDRDDSVDVFTSNAEDLWYFVRPDRKRLDAPLQEMIDGARVQRLPVRHYPAQRYVRRLLSYVPHWPTQCRVASYLPIIPSLDRIRGRYDAVFGVGFPYTGFSYAAWKLARNSSAPLILTPFLHLATPGDKVNQTYTKPHQIELLRKAQTVVVQTDLEGDAVREWGIPGDRILRLGMGVDHELVTGGDRSVIRQSLGLSETATIVGQLGACDPNKGTNDLVRAVASLNETRGETPIHLLLGGNSSPEFEQFAAELPVESSRWLHRLGPLRGPSIADFFAALDLFAMPSRTDSFGIVYLEAWANGLPVIGANAGGVAEVITHGENGLLVEFGDVEGLSASIHRLIRDSALRRRLGDAGREHVSHGFSWDDRFATLSAATDRLARDRDAISSRSARSA